MILTKPNKFILSYSRISLQRMSLDKFSSSRNIIWIIKKSIPIFSYKNVQINKIFGIVNLISASQRFDVMRFYFSIPSNVTLANYQLITKQFKKYVLSGPDLCKGMWGSCPAYLHLGSLMRVIRIFFKRYQMIIKVSKSDKNSHIF